MKKEMRIFQPEPPVPPQKIRGIADARRWIAQEKLKSGYLRKDQKLLDQAHWDIEEANRQEIVDLAVFN